MNTLFYATWVRISPHYPNPCIKRRSLHIMEVISFRWGLAFYVIPGETFGNGLSSTRKKKVASVLDFLAWEFPRHHFCRLIDCSAFFF